MNKLLKTIKALTVLILITTLSACFGTSPPVKPEIQIRSEKLIEQAIRAEQKNEITRAELLLEESFKLSAAVEDTPATVRALINIGRLNRLHQQTTKARNAIDSALTMLTPEMEMYPEAAQEKALLELAAGNSASALSWAQKSVDTEKGAHLGRRLNLVGRVMILQGNDQDASKILDIALKQNIAVSNIEEHANSLRMLGIIARNDRKYTASEKILLEALTLDKNIAVSNKIALDLEELANTAKSDGKLKEAIGYLQRAYLVNSSSGRLHQAKTMKEKCAEIFELLNDKVNADKSRDTAISISNQLKGSSPETTRPSKSP